MNKYKDWDLLDEMPEGWKIDKSCGSPLHGYLFATNGKSIINGQKRALIKQEIKTESNEKARTRFDFTQKKENIVVIDQPYVKALNELARRRFEQSMLNDIMVDLMICEIEGWGKLEYIKELIKSISGLLKRAEITSRLTDGVADKLGEL